MIDFVEVATLDQIVSRLAWCSRSRAYQLHCLTSTARFMPGTTLCACWSFAWRWEDRRGKIVTCRAHGMKYDITNGYVGGIPGLVSLRMQFKSSMGRSLVAIA